MEEEEFQIESGDDTRSIPGVRWHTVIEYIAILAIIASLVGLCLGPPFPAA